MPQQPLNSEYTGPARLHPPYAPGLPAYLRSRPCPPTPAPARPRNCPEGDATAMQIRLTCRCSGRAGSMHLVCRSNAEFFRASTNPCVSVRYSCLDAPPQLSETSGYGVRNAHIDLSYAVLRRMEVVARDAHMVLSYTGKESVVSIACPHMMDKGAYDLRSMPRSEHVHVPIHPHDADVLHCDHI